MLNMIKLLETGKKYSIKELAEKLEVSSRMVRTYKEELEKAGIYVDSIRGANGGYILNQKLSKIDIGISKYEVQLLDAIEASLMQNNFKLMHEYNLFKNKIIDSFKKHKDRWKSDVVKSKKGFKCDEDKKYKEFEKAIKNKNKIKVEFLSATNELKLRTIHPCILFTYADKKYIAAFCEVRKEIRHFRIDRLIRYTVLNDTYEENLIM